MHLPHWMIIIASGYLTTQTWTLSLATNTTKKTHLKLQLPAKGCSGNYPWGGAANTFLSGGGRVFCWQCVRGVGGGEVTCPGGQGVFDPKWGGLIKALACPGGREALTPCVSWGWRGLKKKCGPPPLRIISETALNVLPAINEGITIISINGDC